MKDKLEEKYWKMVIDHCTNQEIWDFIESSVEEAFVRGKKQGRLDCALDLECGQANIEKEIGESDEEESDGIDYKLTNHRKIKGGTIFDASSKLDKKGKL